MFDSKPAAVVFAGARAVGARLGSLPGPLAWGAALAWYGLIWRLSSMPGSSEPASWGWIVLSNSLHAPLFGVWAACLSLLLPRAGGWPVVSPRARAAVLATVALGGLADELHQHLLTAGRDFSVLDIATDVSGALLALELVAHLAAADASPAGFARRLALAAAGSFAAGAVATFVPRCFPGVWWL